MGHRPSQGQSEEVALGRTQDEGRRLRGRTLTRRKAISKGPLNSGAFFVMLHS